ncbi:hypothetical protein X768_17440 [Mesorhizobium sp. LSJC265A00]|nr:hypothetical protein X768_17440 [Mesorhizobium sp. LSJC265A00]ESZ56306.1 hypothetical protein X728_25985 [Mesorhizobium sp. L103C120A0]
MLVSSRHLRLATFDHEPIEFAGGPTPDRRIRD